MHMTFLSNYSTGHKATSAASCILKLHFPQIDIEIQPNANTKANAKTSILVTKFFVFLIRLPLFQNSSCSKLSIKPTDLPTNFENEASAVHFVNLNHLSLTLTSCPSIAYVAQSFGAGCNRTYWFPHGPTQSECGDLLPMSTKASGHLKPLKMCTRTR